MNEVQLTLLSDRGLVRQINEDAMGTVTAEDGTRLLCVADGMGGHQAGDVASQRALAAALETWRMTRHPDPIWRLARCVDEANTAVLNEAASRNLNYGDMGTTIVLLAITERAAFCAHVGDSRAYLLREGNLERLTKDHTEAQELADAGRIDQAAVDSHESSHILTRGLGLEPTAVPDLAGPIPLRLKDSFLLCSDGLTATASEELIRDVLSYFDIASACAAMISHANFRGGPDNTTLVAARVGEDRGPLEVAPRGFELPVDRFRRQVRAAAALVLAVIVAVILLWIFR